MKRISLLAFLLPVLLLPAAPGLRAQTAARMDSLAPAAKAAARHIRLTGRLSTGGNSDFRQLRDLCHQLESVDLSRADAPVVPAYAFHSRHGLRRVALPEGLQRVERQAFYACDSLERLRLPRLTQYVGHAAFAGCGSLRELVIEGVPELGPYAFARCTALRRIEVRAAVPPVAAETAFEGLRPGSVRLVVPRGAEPLYRRAPGWRHLFAAVERPLEVCRPEQCLVPQPVSVQVDTLGAPLSVRRAWRIEAPAALEGEVRTARRLLARRTGHEPGGRRSAPLLRLLTDTLQGPSGAYRLEVSEAGVTVCGADAAGVFYGLMTLDQLLRGSGHAACCDVLPQLVVTDAPRTALRELMVDPARQFIPLDALLRFVDEMARYKFNALHLHLVDDQAWRIEIKHYPRLTAEASRRVGMDDMLRPIEGFYTQDDMRRLVAYAAERHVEIIPEIELPGHEVAAVHVYPRLACGAPRVPLRTTSGVSNELLCPGSEFTYGFLGHVFAELAEVFPSRYIHLGGDEAGNPPLGAWTSCPDCRALKRRLGITADDRADNWRLQEYLFNRVVDTLRQRHGKVPMFWYETDFHTIPAGCVTFAWRHGLTRAAAQAAEANRARIVLCPGEHCYLDYPMQAGDMPEVNWGMPVTSLRQTYALDPAWGMGPDFERDNLLGVAGTLWSECIDTPERLFHMAYPRALALAEAGWSPQARRSWQGFEPRLRAVLRDMQRRGVAHSVAF